MTSPASIHIVQDTPLIGQILSLSMLHAIHQAHPESRLTMELTPSLWPLFATSGLPIEPAPGVGVNPAVTLDLRLDPETSRAAGNSAAPRLTPPSGPHSIPLWKQSLDLAEASGLGPLSPRLPPYLFPQGDNPTEKVRVILAVDAAFGQDNWSRRDFAELMVELSSQHDIVVSQLEAVDSSAGLEVLLSSTSAAPSHLSLLATASLLMGATLLISNHRFLLGLGAALGIPVMGLFGPGHEPRFYEPFAGASTTLILLQTSLSQLSPLEVAGHSRGYLSLSPEAKEWQKRKRSVFVG